MISTSAANSGQRVSRTSSLRMFWTVLKADQRQEQRERDQAGDRRFAQRARSVGARGGVRHLVRHGQTFSTSGRPRRPCGRKIIVMARIENAATSL